MHIFQHDGIFSQSKCFSSVAEAYEVKFVSCPSGAESQDYLA